MPVLHAATLTSDFPTGSIDHLCRYAHRPFAFVARYIRNRWALHAFIIGTVLLAVCCSVSTQYGVKFLVDALGGNKGQPQVWQAFAILVALIAADNILWRIAAFFANSTFVGVTGDLRRDLFRHLTGHAPRYFAERLPGMLTSRVTATSNAVYTVETMFLWNVMPPCAATLVAIALVDRERSDGAGAGRDQRHRGRRDDPFRRQGPAAAS